jgi:hypothetical protein
MHFATGYLPPERYRRATRPFVGQAQAMNQPLRNMVIVTSPGASSDSLRTWESLRGD